MRIYAIRKMPLSIDEEENRCTAGAWKATGLTEQKEKGFAGSTDYLWKIYKVVRQA
jgi:hypothetical protein